MTSTDFWNWKREAVTFQYLESDITDDGKTIIHGEVSVATRKCGHWRLYTQPDKLCTGKLHVHHDALFLYGDAAGCGHGRAWFNHVIDKYQLESDVSLVTIYATSVCGGWTWAEMGFRWDTRPEATGQVGGNVFERLDQYVEMTPDERHAWMAEIGSPVYDPQDSLEKYQGADLSPAEVAWIGKPSGPSRGQSWPGKRILFGSSWAGLMKLI